jgi:nitrogen fixation/metabolism regulation signal transduction histidine kinase
MIPKRKFRKHLIVSLTISLVAFVLVIGVSRIISNYYSPDKVTTRLSREFISATAELDHELTILADKTSKKFPGFNANQYIDYTDLFKNKGIELFVYQHDTLRYWTDNVFSAPFIKDSENFTNQVIKEGNGYYLIRFLHKPPHTFVGVQLIKYDYNFNNDYLSTGFFKRFSVPENVQISLIRNKDHPVFNSEGKFLFSLIFSDTLQISTGWQYAIFILFIISLLCFVTATFVVYMYVMREFGQKWMLFFIFVLDIFIFRALQFYFRFPAELYSTELFNPAWFASSEWVPTLGDFIINSLLIVQLIFLAQHHARSWIRESLLLIKFPVIQIVIGAILLTVSFFLLTKNLTGLVHNSSISFRFENILILKHLSHVGIVTTGIILTCFLLLFNLIKLLFSSLKGTKFAILGVTLLFVFGLLSYLTGLFNPLLLLFFALIIWLLYSSPTESAQSGFRLSRQLLLLMVLAGWATFVVNSSENIREKQKRRLLASHLADARDNLAEFFYNEAAKNVQNDKLLAASLNNPGALNSIKDPADYILNQYFSGYWSRYQIQITVCQSDKKLIIKPGNITTGCNAYFDDKIERFLKPVSVPGLYFLRQSADAMYYLGKIQISPPEQNTAGSTTIFIEISSNESGKGLGYPELLMDRKYSSVDNLGGYSYAFYNHGELVKNVGKYSYNIDNKEVVKATKLDGFYNQNGYNHFVFQADNDTMVVLSREKLRLADMISPFSYLLLLMIIILLIINIVNGKFLRINIEVHTFSVRLQAIMIGVIVVSSIILVTVSLLFINKLNRNKNNEILNEKLNSVMVELEFRYATLHSFDSVSKDEITDMLITQSNTYFTDINVFDTSGYLIASSREQIFREGMISEQMNPEMAYQLMNDKKSVIIQREKIGTYSFLSAYTPLRNVNNQLIGYLNLPYFARQEEIRREISGLVSAFANIYILLIVVTVLLALLLSRFVTRPLQQIGYQFSIVKIGNKNAKIKWNRKDEIGRLVDEYNRMIDEMERSAELLARSERESAWRQMARQVAHEIKNPLTPIKLSMQLLLRAWNDKAPDWDARLKRFAQTLIMQIDTLSSIATEFSDFAQMPEPQIQQFDIIPLVQQSVSLYRDQSDCDIRFVSEFRECIIEADPNQILRVFNNLIKNALQAIPPEKEGAIEIRLTSHNNLCDISFRDNGTGIPPERQARIFSPNFTTKTAGMGLGLAMVKNIIDNSGGRIWFETEPGEGTTFFVSLPLSRS